MSDSKARITGAPALKTLWSLLNGVGTILTTSRSRNFELCVTKRVPELWTIYGVSEHKYAEKTRNTEIIFGTYVLLFIMTPSMMSILSGIVLSLISVNHFNVFSSRVFRCACNIEHCNSELFHVENHMNSSKTGHSCQVLQLFFEKSGFLKF